MNAENAEYENTKGTIVQISLRPLENTDVGIILLTA